MGDARMKLNVMYLLFCLGVAALFGGWADSVSVTVVVLLIMLAISVEDRFIR